jgi:hypothetical protein
LARPAGGRSGRFATSGPDTLGSRGEVRDQHPRVEESPLVGVILDPDEVEAEPVSQQHLLYELVLPISLGNAEYAEEQLHVQHAARRVNLYRRHAGEVAPRRTEIPECSTEPACCSETSI